jgi:hypothetical protein
MKFTARLIVRFAPLTGRASLACILRGQLLAAEDDVKF